METTKEKDERSWSVKNITWPTTNYKILVKISWYYGNKQLEGEDWSWVTSIDNSNRTFRFDKGKPAYEFNSLSYALDFCMMAGANGYNASVVLLPTWTNEIIFVNSTENAQDKWIKETFVKTEDKDA